MSNSISPQKARLLRRLTLTSAVSVFLLVVLGGLVSASQSGGACPDWPTCLGDWAPPATLQARLDYGHRVATLLVILIFSLTTWFAWRLRRSAPTVASTLSLAWAFLILQGLLGGLFVLPLSSTALAALKLAHQALALFTLTASLAAAALSYTPSVLQLRFATPFARLTLASVALLTLISFSGSLVKTLGVKNLCASWPLCDPLAVLNDPLLGLPAIHRLLVILLAGLLLVLVRQAWRTQRTQTLTLVAVTAAATLFLAQALLGIKMAAGFSWHLIFLHQATAAATWSALVIAGIAVGVAGRTVADEEGEALALAGRQRMWRDLFLLTKPIVVALLLVTTLAGMVIGAQAWPPLSTLFWTLLGGFLAAGGCGAINQYIDRHDDRLMQRTQARPIPAGRLTPGEGLAFGVSMAIASFYVMTAWVNFTAALLTLAGILYYVVIYSLLLKKTTVQNIVIGGGAGAIPPLVGWAAATGQLNPPALLLFAVIFLWTPPHFWALALVRRKDYARAGVPMLPVVRGEEETRWKIFLYTLELVALTLLLPLLGLGGSLYLIGALTLGAWLLFSAYKVWKGEGNKAAWKMYRYSSMYLAFLFLVLMADRLR